ncbi:hypothetical protein [Streptomyces sp. NPDC059861]|uniref:hypothetical protein n=1 Tax=Streptomyces sp. NPDC059861 TaxID=3346974 RepID=UPI003663FC52
MKLTCLACPAARGVGQYLCRSCWAQLTPSTQRRLNKRDAKAFERVRSLSRQLQSGVPLAEVSVAA